MATESSQRMSLYLKGECNAFRAKRPVSKPIIFWSDKDIWEYINRYKISYSPIYDKGFDLMKKNYPKLYDYCMDKLKLKHILNTIHNKTVEGYEEAQQ